MFTRLSGLELYVSTTIFDLNMATSVCFYRKTTWQIFLLKSRFLTFFHFYCQWERLNFAWKVYFNIWYSQGAAPRVERSFGPNNSFLYNFICIIYHILQFSKKTLPPLRISNLKKYEHFCILKNMAPWAIEFVRVPCFSIFYFCIFHANLKFSMSGGQRNFLTENLAETAKWEEVCT